MDMQRLEAIASFVKGLNPKERQLVGGLLKCKPAKKTVKKKKNGRYTPAQIKKAWELTKKGLPAKEVAKITKMKAGSISKPFLKKRLRSIKRQEKKR